MTMTELLKACGSGEMPRVRFGNQIGTVQAIKSPASNNPSMQHNGCSVLFDDDKFEAWFHNSDETDKRRKYMRELEFVNYSHSFTESAY